MCVECGFEINLCSLVGNDHIWKMSALLTDWGTFTILKSTIIL